MKRRHLLAAAAGVSITAACGSDPLNSSSPSAGGSASAAPSAAASGSAATSAAASGSAGSGATLVVGSQDYYSNEIIAEIYAQALEGKGYTIKRQFRIGQREVYLPEIQNGSIDLFPEYTGPLLLVWDPKTTAKLADPVYQALVAATPSGLKVLDQSPATDQDSYVVTADFAKKWSLTTISDLSKVTVPLTLGANSEAESRPNGPKGLQSVYGIKVGFTPIEDGGGPLTIKALKDNKIQMAIVYTADPSIATNNLVSLEDDKGLFLASHVVPVASAKVDAPAAAIINKISATMTPSELIGLNAQSVNDKVAAAVIARQWLQTAGI